MTFRALFAVLFSPCLFGHASDPTKIVKGRKLHLECVRSWLPKPKKKGGDPADWPEPFPREFPKVSA